MQVRLAALMTSSLKGIRCFAAGGITLAVVLLLAANAAHAVPVEWTLNNWETVAGPGGTDTVTGSFIYDADTATFSNINIFSSLDSTSFTFAGVGANANTLEFVELGNRVSLAHGFRPLRLPHRARPERARHG